MCVPISVLKYVTPAEKKSSCEVKNKLIEESLSMNGFKGELKPHIHISLYESNTLQE